MGLSIQLCSAKDIIPIRHEVLRVGKPISSCHFDGDTNPETLHFVAYRENKKVGCVSFMFKSHPNISSRKSYQLRGMAVLKNSQNQSIGLHLLNYAENYLIQSEAELIWCNVRITAKGFYLKQNFESDGKTFTIPEVGTHVLMYKYI